MGIPCSCRKGIWPRYWARVLIWSTWIWRRWRMRTGTRVCSQCRRWFRHLCRRLRGGRRMRRILRQRSWSKSSKKSGIWKSCVFNNAVPIKFEGAKKCLGRASSSPVMLKSKMIGCFLFTGMPLRYWRNRSSNKLWRKSFSNTFVLTI